MIKRIYYILISILGVIFILNILPFFFKSLRYDWKNGGNRSPAYSSSIEESVERGVFIGELQISKESTTLGNSVSISAERVWIERAWNSGYRYWDTHIDSSTYNLYLDGVTLNGVKSYSSNHSTYHQFFITIQCDSVVRTEYLSYYEDKSMYKGRFTLSRIDTIKIPLYEITKLKIGKQEENLDTLILYPF